ncbi:hypothetical protein TthHB5008_10010 [Thermus thermophilus]|nr:hypothetical protein TthHB5002_10040 [Thermus thermophilus]BCQ00231.1 hypothetical protein TthHB5008_10010 [Thermus thermophilus]
MGGHAHLGGGQDHVGGQAPGQTPRGEEAPALLVVRKLHPHPEDPVPLVAKGQVQEGFLPGGKLQGLHQVVFQDQPLGQPEAQEEAQAEEPPSHQRTST